MSVDTKRPKKYRKAPITEYRCQFCGGGSPVAEWKPEDRCPKCGKKYDPILVDEG
jgi:rubrerythrin